MPGSEPVSWRTIVYGTPVTSTDGTRIGTVREVLGSDSDDIFHGLRVTVTGEGRDVMVPANDIESMSSDGIATAFTSGDVPGLATYDEAAAYHLASVGWLRKHVGWRDDSKSDEEPG